MQIIVTHNEIEEAVKQTVLQTISLQDGQTVSIRFEQTESDDLIAIIDITKAGSEPQASGGSSGGAKQQTKATGRGRKAAVTTAETASSEDKTETKTEEPENQEESTQAAADQAKTEAEAPWNEQETEGSGNQKALPNETPASAELKIFPNVGSSAAPETPKPETIIPPAKSLFANLVKPTH